MRAAGFWFVRESKRFREARRDVETIAACGEVCAEVHAHRRVIKPSHRVDRDDLSGRRAARQCQRVIPLLKEGTFHWLREPDIERIGCRNGPRHTQGRMGGCRIRRRVRAARPQSNDQAESEVLSEWSVGSQNGVHREVRGHSSDTPGNTVPLWGGRVRLARVGGRRLDLPVVSPWLASPRRPIRR